MPSSQRRGRVGSIAQEGASRVRKTLLRLSSSPLHHALPSVISVIAAAAVSLILVAVSSGDPGTALSSFFVAPLSSPFFLGNFLDQASLLAVAALGMIISIRGGTFNLGGEGQAYAGGLAGTMVLLSLGKGSPSGMAAVTTMLVASLVAAGAGAFLGGAAGVLKRRFGADELIGTYLLSSAAFPVIDYLIGGPLRDQASNLVATAPLEESLRFHRLMPPSTLNSSALFTLALVLCVSVALNRTRGGFILTLAGSAPSFARYAGVVPERAWTPTLALSGAFHGLAGMFAVAGTYGVCHKGFTGGLGWNAIAVALMARAQGLAVLPAALAFAYIVQGSNSALLRSDLPTEATALVQATVFLLVTARLGGLARGKGLQALGERLAALVAPRKEAQP